MSKTGQLRSQAEALAAPLPPLLARAEHLAGSVAMGEHGRRRAGMGDIFWQYRQAQPTDSARRIDWRRSARTDQAYVQEKEWQIAQSVMIWANPAASMRYASTDDLPQKADRAAVLALALTILLIRGGERVGSGTLPPGRGEVQIRRIAGAMAAIEPGDEVKPDTSHMPAHSQAVFISDFLSDIAPIATALHAAAAKGITGTLFQVLDPAEAHFPFKGRTIFESISGDMRHETLKASALRDKYLGRLAARQDQLSQLARQTGWQFHIHQTDAAAAPALRWLYRAMETR